MPTNPAIVAELNRRRAADVSAGKSYGNNKYFQSYDSFAKSGVGKDIASRGTVSPTVITDTGIRDRVIPQIQQDATNVITKHDQTGAVLDQKSTLEADKKAEREDKNKDSIGGFLEEKTDTPAADPYTQKQLDLIDKAIGSRDAGTRAQAETLRRNADRQRNMQNQNSAAEQGSAGLAATRLGSRYTPGASGQIMSTIQQDNLQKLADIDDQEASAVEELRAAQENKDFEAMNDKLTLLKGVRDERMATLEAQRKQEADDKKDLDTQRNSILQELGKNSAPADVIQAVAGAETVADMVTAAGEHLQTGEYAEYARAVKAAGLTPVDPNTYYAKKIYGENGAPGSDPLSGDVPFEATIDTAAANAGTLKGQETAAAQMAALAKSGDYKSLFTRMKGLARQGMTSATRTDVEQGEQQLSSLDNMRKVLSDYEAAGGDTGFLKGNEDEIARKIGKLATDPRFAAISTQMTAAFQQYRQNMTGAAFGAKENADYKKVVPTADKSFELNMAVMDGLHNFYKQNLDSSYETQLGEGYNNLKDYVEQGLTPTGKVLLKTEQDAKNKVTSLIQDKPETAAQIDTFKGLHPDASAYDVLQFLGIPVATSNEVSMTDPSAGIVGGYDIESYATDPKHEQKVAAIYRKTEGVNDAQSADAYIRSIVPGSPLTGEQVMAAANATGVSPGMILAIMQQDSTFGTAGKAVRTKNPGNVGNTDSGATKSFGDWQEGVLAVANNLAKRKVS